MVALLPKVRKGTDDASPDDLRQPAAHRECRVAVGDQGDDEDLPVHLAELQDLQSACRQPPAFIWLVVRKGGLPVAGAGAQLHAVRAGRGEHGGFDEYRGGRAPIEPCGQRWHGEPDVLGDQFDEGIDVGQLPGADVPLQELPHARIADRRLRGGGGPHSLPGTRQQAVDRRGADGERLADLGVAEAKHVVEQQGGALTRRQALQGGDEGKADLLPADDFVLGAHRPGEVVIADRLHPGQLRLGRCERRTGPRRGAVTGRVTARLACPQHVEADVGGDPVEPRGEGPRPVVRAKPAPGPLQRVLNRVLGVGARPEHAVAMAEDRPLLRPGQSGKRHLIPGGHPGEQLGRLGGLSHRSPVLAVPAGGWPPEMCQAVWLATPTTWPCGSANRPKVTPGTDVAGWTTRPPWAVAASSVAATSSTPTKNVTTGSAPCSGLIPPGTAPSTPESM